MASNNDHGYARSEDEPSTSKRRRTGFSCAVAECSGTHADGLSLHQFPTDPSVRRQWINFVRTCRANFGPSFGTPTSNSRICSRHFTPDCYPVSYSLSESMGLSVKQKKLQPGAVPTIQKHAFSKPTRATPSASFSKFPTTVTSANTGVTAMTASSTTSTTTSSNYTISSSTVTTTVPIFTSPISSIPPLQVSKVRGAYAKRERKRVSAKNPDYTYDTV